MLDNLPTAVHKRRCVVGYCILHIWLLVLLLFPQEFTISPTSVYACWIIFDHVIYIYQGNAADTLASIVHRAFPFPITPANTMADADAQIVPDYSTNNDGVNTSMSGLSSALARARIEDGL